MIAMLAAILVMLIAWNALAWYGMGLLVQFVVFVVTDRPFPDPDMRPNRIILRGFIGPFAFMRMKGV